MKIEKLRSKPIDETFKGELVSEKDELDTTLTKSYRKNNPYKTPPNNLTTKSK